MNGLAGRPSRCHGSRRQEVGSAFASSAAKENRSDDNQDNRSGRRGRVFNRLREQHNTTVTAPSSGSPGGPSVSIVAGASGLTTTAYSPNPITVSRGNSVTFINNDTTSHTATASGVFDTNLIAPGGRVAVTFQNSGSFTYRCSVHPNMTGTIVVQ